MTIPLTSSLVAQTVAIDDPRQLLPFADQTSPLLWVRKGHGLVGLGEALRLEFSGPDRFTRAAAAWRDVCAAAVVTDEVRRPGTGLVAFGTFAFDDESSATSVLIVPRTIIGRYPDASFITRVSLGDGAEDVDPVTTAYGPEYRIQLTPVCRAATATSTRPSAPSPASRPAA